jgi:hypothetical protein
MDTQVLFNPLFWVVVALFVGIWKAGSWLQNIHEENVRAKEAASRAACDTSKAEPTDGHLGA